MPLIERDSSLPVLVAMSVQLGAAVAVPTALLAIGGDALDERFGTHVFLFLGLGLGFALSMLLVWRIVQTAQSRLGKSD